MRIFNIDNNKNNSLQPSYNQQNKYVDKNTNLEQNQLAYYNQNNQNIYKCTLLDNTLIYTVKDESIPNEIERRYLVEENYTI